MQKIFQRFLIIFFVSPFFITSKAEQWDKNMDYCSYFEEKVAIAKGEGLVMNKLIKYADKCHNTLNFMTKYLLEEE